MSHALPTIETSVAERMSRDDIGQYLPGAMGGLMLLGLVAQFGFGYEVSTTVSAIAIVVMLAAEGIRAVFLWREKRRVRALTNDPGTLALLGKPSAFEFALPIHFRFPAMFGRTWTELRMLPVMEEWCAKNVTHTVRVLPMLTDEVAKGGICTLKVWFEDAGEREAFAKQFAEYLS